MLTAPALGILLGAVSGLAPLQPSVPQDLEQLITAARTGRTVIRPQAARRIVRLWAQAESEARAGIIQRLRAVSGDSPATLARIGPALVEVLGEFGDESLRRLLWRSLSDTDFPWRPYAARSLAGHPVTSESPRFLSALADPIPPVRVAALLALANLGQPDHAPAVRQLLDDEDDRVRRSAADLLVQWGQPSALWWLYEELLREDHFFDRPTGEQARYQAWNLLSPRLGKIADAEPYDPGRAPSGPESVASLQAVRTRLLELKAGERPILPPQARAAGEVPTELLGMELRSCRKGEMFLRWTANDLLLVGQGNPARVVLPEGTVQALLDATADARAGLSDKRLFGSPGCDMEQFHVRSVRTLSATQWIVSCGPEPVPDLRPPGLNSLGRALLAAIPKIPASEAAADPRLVQLRLRARAVLQAIGGPLD